MAVPASIPIASGGWPVHADTDHQPAESAQTVRMRAAVKHLPVADETRAGYDRDKFRHWVDADDDCRDTRDEVLAEESKVSVSGCDITGRKWFSYYDGRTWRESSDVDIDHLVPLAEAWDSGAKRSNANTRQRYANDLSDNRALVAVTDNVNQSKSDSDIAEWLPQRSRCRYLREWTAVKTRWSLTVNRIEKRTLRRLADDCRYTVLQVTRARIVLKDGGGGGGGDQPLGRMRIAEVVYDPPGTDTENAETVTLVNRGSRVSMPPCVSRLRHHLELLTAVHARSVAVDHVRQPILRHQHVQASNVHTEHFCGSLAGEPICVELSDMGAPVVPLER